MTRMPPHDAPTLSGLRLSHTPQHIHDRLQAPPDASYLRDCVYGAIDGTVTTFAVVSGAAGASLAPEIVLILGLANLVGDGFSMAAGNYLGTRADEQLREKARETEGKHIDAVPDGEREEIRQIFSSMGFASEQLDRAVEVITSDRQRWIETMLKEEYGLSSTSKSPYRAAAATLLAFLLIGVIPLLAFLIGWIGSDFDASVYYWSVCLTAAAFFLVGAFKSRFVTQSWYLAGLETLMIGGAAAALAYGVGTALGETK